MFYVTVPATGFLILVFGFFDPRGRLLHDHLAGILVYRAEAAGPDLIRHKSTPNFRISPSDHSARLAQRRGIA